MYRTSGMSEMIMVLDGLPLFLPIVRTQRERMFSASRGDTSRDNFAWMSPCVLKFPGFTKGSMVVVTISKVDIVQVYPGFPSPRELGSVWLYDQTERDG